MAHKKAAGSAKNLRDSKPKYRGVKVFGGQPVVAGNIIIRQKGDKYDLGENTYKGRDFSIHAATDGFVAFKKRNVTRFDGRKYLKTTVYVTTEATIVATPTQPAKEEAAEKPAKKAVAKKTTAVKKAPAKKAPKKEEATA